MKKLLIAIFVLSIGLSVVADCGKCEKYNAMDLGIWFGLPESMEEQNVRGLRIGFPVSGGHGYVSGLELALFCAGTEDIRGLQLSLVALADKVSGAQISLVNMCDGRIKGSQFGVVNYAGKSGWQFGLMNSGNNAKFQLGLINMNENGLWPFMLFVNFGRDSFKSSETIRTEGK